MNTLAPGRCGSNFTMAIFKLISQMDILSCSCVIDLRWLPHNPIDDKSTLVQVMVWCLQAPNHYLSQYWPGFVSPYGITRPQWVKDKIGWGKCILLWQCIKWEKVSLSSTKEISNVTWHIKVVNSLAPGRSVNNFQNRFFKLIYELTPWAHPMKLVTVSATKPHWW